MSRVCIFFIFIVLFCIVIDYEIFWAMLYWRVVSFESIVGESGRVVVVREFCETLVGS